MPKEKEEMQRLINHLRAQIEHLHQIATQDEKTGLYNSFFFKSVFEFELNKAKREGTFSIVILDLDLFKKINDTYGHITADEILKKVADVLKKELRGADVISRFGGEEFFIILPSANLSQARIIAERLRMSIQKDEFLKKFKVTLSAGLSEYIKNDTFEKMANRADKALYKAKETGRNKVCTMDGLGRINCYFKPEKILKIKKLNIP